MFDENDTGKSGSSGIGAKFRWKSRRGVLRLVSCRKDTSAREFNS
jgi:hypothetical protein